jgi:hypothetical protein
MTVMASLIASLILSHFQAESLQILTFDDSRARNRLRQ